MSQTKTTDLLGWDKADGRLHVRVAGKWVLAHYQALEASVRRYRQEAGTTAPSAIDVSGLEALDTSGARWLFELLGEEHIDVLTREDSGLSAARCALLATVAQAMKVADEDVPQPRRAWWYEFFGNAGVGLERVWQQFVSLLGFTGIVLESLAFNVFRPGRWRVTAIVAQIEKTGLNAVPIVALLTFMVGAVVAFLGATILQDFGATLYTVNLVGFSFLREFAVLLTAILMAGRTASAFTAQIGSMKVNEEIDAIQVQGLSPIELLVLPRVLAMQISLPILTLVGMLAGIAGGMLVSAFSLGISPQRFLDIFVDSLSVRHFFIGMSKAPIFAFLIAVIGCLEGLKVHGSAQSVGEHTTAAVVQSIFVVIMVDALAALFFMEMGW